MAEPLRVMAADLDVSAATVDAHADSMRSRHAMADDAIESSQAGLPAAAGAALASAVGKWQADTSTLYGRLVGHGHGMRHGAASYTQMDEKGAADLSAADRALPELDLGL